jgi:hypothetical protein
MGGGDAFGGQAMNALGHAGPRRGLHENHGELMNMRRLETCMNAARQAQDKNVFGEGTGSKNEAGRIVGCLDNENAW